MSSDGRHIAFYLYLLGADVADDEENIDNVAACMRCARREGRPAALLFSHAASFVGLVWHAAIEEFANQIYGASASASCDDSTLSRFGAEWPAAAASARAPRPPPAPPHRMVACAFDFGGHGLSDDVLPFPLPVPSVASAAEQTPLEAGVASVAQSAMCDRAAGSDSVLWRAWRADIGAVIDLLASYVATAPAEAAAISASIRSHGPRAADAIQFVGIGHSLGGAALLLAGQEYPCLFRQLVLYEPVMCDPTFELFYSSSPIPFDRAAVASGAFPLHESQRFLEARPFRISKEKRHVLTTTTLRMESILPKFAVWKLICTEPLYCSPRVHVLNHFNCALIFSCRLACFDDATRG
jgi:pimeloyl-ACP methyl ester carboxylesterase